MESILTKSLLQKNIGTPQQLDMAIKEVLQELILVSLSTTDFFSKAGFYGGTSLRVFHGLRRFSEDLDFALLKEDCDFRWTPYFKQIEQTFQRFGLRIETIEREKISATDTRSAFIKENAIETMKILLPDDMPLPSINHNQVTTIKFEVDTVPPEGATYEWLNLSQPFFANIRVFDIPSLFAGKISAVLLRQWKNRVKGRDFYDYLYYVGRGAKINMAYLSQNLAKTGRKEELSLDGLKKLLAERFETIDFQEAAKETARFLEKAEEVDCWDKDLFLSTLDRLEAR
ncbi:MAG: nucleotidyl transferase AbiEii/AbiGii toxin family protein [Bacilli bacterium]|nr:nucleotidyl transferase AbiEii/AbiGii toxin family protein [Bacilli bacterium]